MKILILKTNVFRKKNMRTIFVISSYDIYVLAGFCDQIPMITKLLSLLLLNDFKDKNLKGKV